MTDLAFQVDISVRLLIASLLGAAIGVEREVHGHAAGMRTHLLVSLGSALFTVLSIFGFPTEAGAPLDPSRVAAQIVSGIGFLGAGAIIKEGFSVRGLTTAASLWATAAVGMGAGAAQHIVATVAAAIVIFSLWPLSRLEERVHGREKELLVLRLQVATHDAIAAVSTALTDNRVEIVSVETQPSVGAGYNVEIGVRVRTDAHLDDALRRIRGIEGVASVRSTGSRGD